MLRSDARTRTGAVSINMDSISIEILSRIERELEPYDVVSMVFLLYDAPETALKRLLVYQSRSKDDENRDLSFLEDWAVQAQQRPTWRDEFLEALAICQIYKVIRNLGFPVEIVKKRFVPDNLQISIYVNPMKKLLYKLCENITSDKLEKLQYSLRKHNFDTKQFQYCEMIFMELMVKSFITIKIDRNQKAVNAYQTENLAKIIEKIPGLVKFANEMRNMDNITDKGSTSGTSKGKNTTVDQLREDSDEDKYVENVFDDICKQMFGLSMKDKVTLRLKNKTVTNTIKIPDDAYNIKNPKRVGVCYIINQDTFKDPKDSVKGSLGDSKLDERLGSNKDKIVLEKTMASLNFEVITHRNLNHEQMMEFIKNIVQFRIQYDDSMFMLCILSHGVKDHVYAADSVKVKVEDIQNLLDDEFQKRQLYDIPKVLIIQACQAESDVTHPTLVADSPSKYFMRKSHFLTYWATAPELEAFRDERRGSIFIQILCFMIQKDANKDHLQDIFTKVNAAVTRICSKLQRDQVPLFKSTLLKKLYLQIPEIP